ncbi:MAG: hypothetical protein HFJ45_02035 [Clostridia bacterium]|nr:hypothetical protein [Clostridia bacterium]
MENFFKNIIKYIGIFIVAIVFLVNIFLNSTLVEITEHVSITFYTVISLLVSIAIVILFFKFDNIIKKLKLSKKTKVIIFIGILILYMAVQVGWIYIRHAVPTADQDLTYQTSVALADDDIESAKWMGGYLQAYSQQLTLAYVFSIIFKIFNTRNPVVLQYYNALSNCITIIALFLIAKQLSKKYEVSKTRTVLISLMFITLPMLATFVYGDLPSIPFCLLAIYFIMKYCENKKIRYSILSAICLSYACILRMNNLIFLIALVIYDFLEILHIEEKNVKKILKEIIVLVVFIAVAFLPSKILKDNLLDRFELKKDKPFPTIGFLCMGMNESGRSYGWYNGDIAQIAFNGFDEAPPIYKEMIKERIKTFVKKPIYFAQFYCVKIISTWTENTYGAVWYNQQFNFAENEWRNIENEKIAKIQDKLDGLVVKSNKHLQVYQKAIILIIFGMTLCVLVKYRKNISNEVLLLVLCFMGGFMFHILWETKSRYIISYIIVLMPLVSINLGKLNLKKVKMLNEKGETQN